jgi:hypothetical protein
VRHAAASSAGRVCGDRPPARARAGVAMLFGFGKPKPKVELTDEQIAETYGLQIARFDVLPYPSTVAAPRDDLDPFKSGGYQLRSYWPMWTVETAYDKRPEGYMLLDGYTQAGENALGLPMPRTAPCMTQPCASPKLMRYLLPAPHTPTTLEGKEAVPPPAPTYDVLRTVLLPRTAYAVARFSGYGTPDVVLGLRDSLKALLAADGVALAEGCDERLVLAQYNELFSLPWKRDNELWLPVAL